MTFTSENYWGVNLLTYLLLRKKLVNNFLSYPANTQTDKQTPEAPNMTMWRREGFCRPGQRSVVPPLRMATPILIEEIKNKY